MKYKIGDILLDDSTSDEIVESDGDDIYRVIVVKRHHSSAAKLGESYLLDAVFIEKHYHGLDKEYIWNKEMSCIINDNSVDKDEENI